MPKNVLFIALFIVLPVVFCVCFASAQELRQNVTNQNSTVLVLIEQANLRPVDMNALRDVQIHYYTPACLIGTTRKEVALRMQQSGMSIRSLTEISPKKEYAVITHKRSRSLPLEKQSARLVYSSNSETVIEGTSESLDAFEKRGIVIRNITSSTLNPFTKKTYLPASSVSSSRRDSIVELISDSSVGRYIKGLEDLRTRHYLSSNRDSVFDWVRNKFLAMGFTDVQLDSFQLSGTWQCNVVATLPGRIHPEYQIIVGGHLDAMSNSVDHAPGADDNASGTAAALEIARVIMQADYQPSVTFKFIGFGAEEAGLVGSRHYANTAFAAGDNIKMMMNFDMIGNRIQTDRDREFRIVVPNQSVAYGELFKEMTGRYTTLKPLFDFSTGSDDASFYNAGYNTVWSFEQDFSSHYHTENDVLQFLDMSYAGDIVRAGVATLLTLDAMPQEINNVRVFDYGNGTTLAVIWDEPDTKDKYCYSIGIGTAPGVYTRYVTSQSNETAINNLTPGVPYYIGVTLVDLAGMQSVITEQTGIPYVVPRAPLGVYAVRVAGKTGLCWKKNQEKDIRGYAVYTAPSAETPFTKVTALPIADSLWVEQTAFSTAHRYYVTAIDFNGNESAPSDILVFNPAEISDEGQSAVPKVFALYQNYPNPFNPQTSIRFALPVQSFVTVSVYDMLGKEVAIPVSGEYPPGVHEIEFSSMTLSSGIYAYRLQCMANGRGYTETKKLVIIK